MMCAVMLSLSDLLYFYRGVLEDEYGNLQATCKVDDDSRK